MIKEFARVLKPNIWKFNISGTDIKEMADIENNRENLRKIYYDPKIGFISAQKLYLKLKKTIPLSEIQKFLDEQEIYQISKEIRTKYPFRHMIVYSSNDQWQIDLIDFSKYSRWNKGFKYLLCAVDVYSRKAFVVPIKSKSFSTDAMKSILNIAKPILIQSDNGSEFLNKSFQALLKSFKVQHTTAQVGDHNRQGIIERFNRTIEAMIAKYQESRKTNRYIDVLDDIVFNYNNTYHRTIKDTPENRYIKNQSHGHIYDFNFVMKLSIGDKVRIVMEKKTFQKGYELKYSKAVYQICEGNGYTFRLKGPDGIILPKKYKYYQLKKVGLVQSYAPHQVTRETPSNMRQKRNKREIEELEKYTVEPLNKKRRVESASQPIISSKRNKRFLDVEENEQLRKRTRVS
jgi:hypothetical protein